jgi:hypothetical protein
MRSIHRDVLLSSQESRDGAFSFAKISPYATRDLAMCNYEEIVINKKRTSTDPDADADAVA